MFKSVKVKEDVDSGGNASLLSMSSAPPDRYEGLTEGQRRERQRLDRLAEQKRMLRLRKQRIANGEDPSISEEERLKIAEKLEKTRERDRLRKREQKWKLSGGTTIPVDKPKSEPTGNAIRLKRSRERMKRLASGEIPSATEEERQQAIETLDKQKEAARLANRRIREEMRRRTGQMDVKPKVLMEEEERKQMEYFKKQAWLSNMSREEQEHLRKRSREHKREKWEAMTEDEKEEDRRRRREWWENLCEERKKKYIASSNNSAKKRMKKPEMKEKLYKYILEYQRKRVASETPEQRWRRLTRYKVNAEKRKIRRKWEEDGMEKKEIKGKLKKFGEALWRELEDKKECFPLSSEYKPRRRKSKKKAGNEDKSEMVLDPETGEFSMAPSSPTWGDYDLPASPASPPSPPTADPTFSCAHCSVSPFETDSDLRSHLRAFHLSVSWKCPKCEEILLSAVDFSEHYKIAHKQTHPSKEASKKEETPDLHKFLCMRCPWTPDSPKISFKSSQDLRNHVKHLHSNSYWPCSRCSLLKYSKQSLQVHEKLCSYKIHQTNN